MFENKLNLNNNHKNPQLSGANRKSIRDEAGLEADGNTNLSHFFKGLAYRKAE